MVERYEADFSKDEDNFVKSWSSTNELYRNKIGSDVSQLRILQSCEELQQKQRKV
jgi:hypothetical protein